jgi:hypothetical protein
MSKHYGYTIYENKAYKTITNNIQIYASVNSNGIIIGFSNIKHDMDILVNIFSKKMFERYKHLMSDIVIDCLRRVHTPPYRAIIKGMYPETDSLPKQHISPFRARYVDDENNAIYRIYKIRDIFNMTHEKSLSVSIFLFNCLSSLEIEYNKHIKE